MPAALRYVLATVAGIVVALGTIAGVEMLGHRVYPPPTGIDFSNPEAVKTMMAGMPVGALLFVLGGWLLGTFLGTLAACRIAAAWPMRFAAIIGGILLAATIANLVMIPHPLWFSIVAVVAIVAAAWLAGRLMTRR